MVLSQFRPVLTAELVSDFSNSIPSTADLSDHLAYARFQLNRGNHPEAQAIFSYLVQGVPLSSRGGEGNVVSQLSQEHLNAIQGEGGFSASRAEYLVNQTMGGLFDLAPLGAMVGAGLSYRLARFGLLGSAARLGLSSPLVRPAASLLAFGAEATLFPVYGRMGNMALGRQVDWSSEGLTHDIQSSFFVLGGLKFFGMAGNQSLRWYQQNALVRGGLSQRALQTLVPQTAMYLGILSGHQAEQWSGLVPETSTGQLMTESFVTLAHFNAAARLVPLLGGSRVQQLERNLDQESGRIGERWLDQVRTGIHQLTQGSEMALAGSREIHPGSEVRGPRSEVRPTPIMMMENNGQGRGPNPGGKAPAIRRGIPVRPDQTIVSIGRGSMLTTRGGTEATRSAAINGIDHPETLARLAEDFRLLRWDGYDESGQRSWIRISDGRKMTWDDIAQEFGPQLLRESGVREIPLEGNAQRLPVRHGALLPEALRGSKRVLKWMGLSRSEIKETSLQDQVRNFEYASNSGIYGLWAALSAQIGLGFPLYELAREGGLHSSRYGASQGTAAPGIERWMEMFQTAHDRGRDSATYVLQSALMENARGLYLNTILPHFSFREAKENPQAIERILPPTLEPGQMPNTGGVNTAFSQACASGLYALWGAHRAMIRTGIPGEYPMDAMMVMGVDATFSPYHTAPMAAGFSRKAPATIMDMLGTLRLQGRLPEEIAEAYDQNGGNRGSLWERLPEDLRRQAMNESSAPFTRYASGLVVGEASAAMPWMNFQRAIEMGLWPSSRLLGIGINAGEGGAPNLAAMDQGIVTAIRVALQMSEAHGVTPGLVQAHGTSTALNNIAELQSLYQALRYQGLAEPMAISAIKGLVGHAMGAASAVDMVMGVQSLLEGQAPGLFNFRMDDIDPRYAERAPGVLKQFRFSSEPIRNFGEGILMLSEGFLSSDAAAVIGRFPQDLEEAADLLRDYNFPPHVIAEWKVRAPEHRARVQELNEAIRSGELTYRDIAINYGFNE